MKLTGDGIVRVRLTSIVTVLAMVVTLLPALAIVTAPAAQAATNALTINAVNARTVGDLLAGQPITHAYATATDPNPPPVPANYKWLITSDDVGDPNDAIADCVPGAGAVDPAKPGNCQWPSIRGTSGNVPIIAQGDSTVTGQDLRSTALTLPNGKYLISILADGYTIGGQHFTVPLNTTPLVVPLQANPVPLGTLRVRVFHDNAPVDGTYEANTETGGQTGQPDLSGFVAHLSDVLGEVTTDWFGNPLCTNYERTAPDNLHPNGQVKFARRLTGHRLGQPRWRLRQRRRRRHRRAQPRQQPLRRHPEQAGQQDRLGSDDHARGLLTTTTCGSSTATTAWTPRWSSAASRCRGCSSATSSRRRCPPWQAPRTSLARSRSA